MNSIQYVTVDVFTREKYMGNQLAIVQLPPGGLAREQKRIIAREFNYSETTFVHRRENTSKNEWDVDIFTLDQELPFAGHPTIGTAIHLLKPLSADGNSTTVSGTFNLKAGRVSLSYDSVEQTAQAAIPHNVHIHEAQVGSAELTKLQPRIGRLPSQAPVVSIVTGMTFVLVELDSLDSLTFANPTPHPLQISLDDGKQESFIGCYFYVRQSATEGDGVARLCTRMIESSVGEDAATGSAACTLACYLTIQQHKQATTTKYSITQGVEMGRRSEIGVDVTTNAHGRIETVLLSGSAVQIMEGRLVL